MNPLSKLLRANFTRIIICWLAAGLIRAVWGSSRWRAVGAAIPAAYWDDNRPFILAFWHGRLMMLPYCWPHGRSMSMLISHHRDGDMIARTIGHFELGAIRGSTAKAGKKDKGGGAALRAMLTCLKSGACVGITPDGPRGPRRKVDGSALALARLSGAPVIPVSFATTRRIHLKSWDRFLVALPFSRGVFVWGEPVFVSRDAGAQQLAQAAQTLEDTLNRITDEADALCNYPCTEEN